MKSFEEILGILNAEIENINWERHPEGLYKPVQYTLSLGGKRIRPALALMACNLFTDDIEPVVRPALGIEIFHNFTLLHDDIMDKADIRRGKATVHKKWNENTAILSGDVMQIIAYEFISETPAPYLKPVLDLFSKTAVEICEGQQYDVDFESRYDVSPDEYIEMIRLKTAVLLGCALKTGALIGGAGQEDARLLYDFGINMGLAFQLKDDWLDVYGNESAFGKKIGGDILCNKNTYLLIHAKKLAENEQKKELQHWLFEVDVDPKLKIQSVTRIYDFLHIGNICEDAMKFYYEKAIASLEKVAILETKKQELMKLAQKLLLRID